MEPGEAVEQATWEKIVVSAYRILVLTAIVCIPPTVLWLPGHHFSFEDLPGKLHNYLFLSLVGLCILGWAMGICYRLSKKTMPIALKHWVIVATVSLASFILLTFAALEAKTV